MKIKQLIPAFAALLLLSCGKENPVEPVKPVASDYTGTVTVVFLENPFDNENITVNFTPAEDGRSASLTIQKIRFVPQMPVTVDVTVPGIQMESTPEKVVLSCETTVPLAMGGENPRYTVTNFQGEIVGNELTFSLNFGDYPTSFKGVKQ